MTKLNAAGSALIYSTLIDASDKTWTGSLAVDASGSAVALAGTYAYDFPTTPGALRQCNLSQFWGAASILLKLAPDGSHLLYSTHLGADSPSPAPLAALVALDSSGDVYLAGADTGTLPVVPGSFGWNGSGAFVARMTPAPFPSGSVSCVANAASRRGPAIAGGEIVDIFGNGIGPAQTVSATAPGGQVETSLGGIQVLVNGVAAPLISAGPNQIRAIVPFETAANSPIANGPATIQILNGPTTVGPITAPVAVLAPGIFTVDSGATGQALMLNEDSTLNSLTNPARQGSYVTIWATGMGETYPLLATGALAMRAAPLIYPAESPGAGEVAYAGAAPGFTAGLTQINLKTPVTNPHGFVGLSLLQQSNPPVISQAGVYFFIQ